MTKTLKPDPHATTAVIRRTSGRISAKAAHIKLLPQYAYSVVPGDERQVVLLKRGEMGFRPIGDRCKDEATARRMADHYNKGLKVTKAQELAMLAGSMRGFDVPAADPRTYEKS